MKGNEGRVELERAFAELEHELPVTLPRLSMRIRQPRVPPIRIAVAFGLIILGAFAFLPVIGIEFLPVGLLLLAVDVPLLRKPIARLLVWMLGKWSQLRRWRSYDPRRLLSHAGREARKLAALPAMTPHRDRLLANAEHWRQLRTSFGDRENTPAVRKSAVERVVAGTTGRAGASRDAFSE